MLRYADLELADGVIDATDQFLWKNWIRRTPIFQDHGAYFTDLEDRLAAADGNIRGKALNVLRPVIETKEGEFKIIGGDDAIRLDVADERNALIVEGIIALYDNDPDLLALLMSDAYYITVDSEGNADSPLVAVGQRGGCPHCAGVFYGCSYCRYSR